MSSSSASSSKNNGTTTQSNTYGNTTTSNPYVTSTTTNKGTTTSLKGTQAAVNDYINANIENLLNQYLNPSLDTTTNQALLENYANNVNDQTRTALENNIIYPLTERNMIRSSQATDLYNGLSKTQAQALDDYAAALLSNTQSNTADVINTLMNLYYNGYNMVSGNQAQSLNTSAGNATSNTSGTSPIRQRQLIQHRILRSLK